MADGLYIVAYDISDPRRLRRVRHVVRDYASGGQKSAYECFLSRASKLELLERVAAEMEPAEDRVCCIRTRRTKKPVLLGIAEMPVDPEFVYFG